MTDPLFSIPMIERFIGFDTISRNSNLPLIHFVRDYLADLGIETSEPGTVTISFTALMVNKS